MSTIRLTTQQIPALQPTLELQTAAQSAARYAFTATTPTEAAAWQVACRAALTETLGFLDTAPVDLAPHLVEEVDRGDFIRRKVVISTATQARMPVYLLIPKGATGPLPVVIAYAGHGYGVSDIVGLWEDGEERWSEDGYHKDFGIALCRRGFLVAAPEIAGFGERQTD